MNRSRETDTMQYNQPDRATEMTRVWTLITVYFRSASVIRIVNAITQFICIILHSYILN